MKRPQTLYRLPSAPTEHPSSKYPIFFTIAAMPHELSLAARRPISLASARKNWRSASVVSRAKKCVNMPMIIRSSSVGSLTRLEPMSLLGRSDPPLHQGQKGSIKTIRFLEFVCILTKEEDALIYELANDQSENFAQIST